MTSAALAATTATAPNMAIGQESRRRRLGRRKLIIA
jgi:hypothetical protein